MKMLTVALVSFLWLGTLAHAQSKKLILEASDQCEVKKSDGPRLIEEIGNKISRAPASDAIIYYLPFSHSLVIEVQSQRAYIGDESLEAAKEQCRSIQQKFIASFPKKFFREGFCDYKLAQAQFPEPPKAYDGARVEIQILDDALAKKVAEQYKGSCEEHYAHGYIEEYRKEICEKGE